jgi:hypothetical protein
MTIASQARERIALEITIGTEKLALITKSGEIMMMTFVMMIHLGEDGVVFPKNHMDINHNLKVAHMAHIGMEEHVF